MEILKLFSERFMGKIERKRKILLPIKTCCYPYKKVTRKMHVNV